MSSMDWGGALCAQVGGDVWFPESGACPDEAKKVCTACPLIAACLERALGLAPADDHGVWGGTTKRERNTIRRQRRKCAKAMPALALAS